MNNSIITLCLYGGATFCASLFGGLLPSLLQLTHRRLQTAISFIAGLMLGIALLHLIPHAAEETHSVDCAVALTLGGFLMMFFLQRIFHYHQHGIAEDPAALGSDHVACCGHSPALVADLEILHPATSKLSWMADCLGLGFHSLLDGLALESMVAGK